MGNKLYVGNLPYSFRDNDLEQTFGQYGAVSSAKVMMERDTGRSKGFGFVEMGSDAEAQAAIAGVHGQNMGGRDLVVNEARPMEPRPPHRRLRRWRQWWRRLRRRRWWWRLRWWRWWPQRRRWWWRLRRWPRRLLICACAGLHRRCNKKRNLRVPFLLQVHAKNPRKPLLFREKRDS